MGQPFDRYPALGKEYSADSMEDAVRLVREKWPAADCEGSTGLERSFAIRDGNNTILIAHAWAPRRRWKVRIAEAGSGILL